MKTIINKCFLFTLVLSFIFCMILQQVNAQTLERSQYFEGDTIGVGEVIDWGPWYGGPGDTCVFMSLVYDDTLDSQVMEVVTNPSNSAYSVHCWASYNPVYLNDPYVTVKLKNTTSVGYVLGFKVVVDGTNHYMNYHPTSGTDTSEAEIHYYLGNAYDDYEWHTLELDLQSDVNDWFQGDISRITYIIIYGDCRIDDLLIYEGSPNPSISPSPSSLQFSADEGGSNPSSKYLVINKSGTGTFSWSASENPDRSWLSLTNTTGGDGDSVTVSVNISGLSDSTYTGTIRITDSNATNSPQDVIVTLTVNDTTSSGGSGVWLLSGDDIYYDDGNVGIGTSSPQSELAVNGEITAKEITVTETGWADFVFKPDYDLRSIEQIEKYILENSRLPDIPSETEIQENGVSLGEMQIKLLQKIEELTLYIIEQEKRIEKLEFSNSQ